MASSGVFAALDTALLTSPGSLPAVLDDEPEQRDALQALARIGPPAVRFAPTLLDWIDTVRVNHRHEVPAALGRVGRGDPATVAAVLARLDSPDPEVRRSIASRSSIVTSFITASRPAFVVP